MPLRTADAIILRTYALKESDKIVSFFTREFGKCRGVARAARRPKSKFGSSLEPLSRVKVQFFEREGKDLSNIDHCELISSMVAAGAIDLVHSIAVSLMVEVADRMLPDHEANDAVFRLFLAVLPALSGPDAWLPLTYYLLWMVRLGGFLPGLDDELSAALLRLPLAQAADLLPAGLCAGAAGQRLRHTLKYCLEDHLESRLISWPILAGLEDREGAEATP
jgi:DNA repair protein RecO (recombination protein O)